MSVSVNCHSSTIKDNVKYVNEMNAEVVGMLVSDKQMRLGFE